MNEEAYLLAKAVLSSVHASLMNAWRDRDDEQKANRHFRQADHLENKFKSQYGFHPQRYIEIYEQQG